MRIVLILAALIMLGPGCSKVQHLDQLLTLKGLADEQESLKKHVESQDAKFEKMLAEEKAGTLDEYFNKRKIQRAFGDPIYVKQAIMDNQELDTWMYRYSTQYFNSEKIYLYFDADDNLVQSRYVGSDDGEIR